MNTPTTLLFRLPTILGVAGGVVDGGVEGAEADGTCEEGNSAGAGVVGIAAEEVHSVREGVLGG